MKTTFVLIHGDYDGPMVDKFEDIQQMNEKVTHILEEQRVRPYGQYVCQAFEVVKEFKFKPKEVATKYEAVEAE